MTRSRRTKPTAESATPREARRFSVGVTRMCLRSGTVQLPRSLHGVLPEGQIAATDTERDSSLQLWTEAPRSLAGLGEFFAAHDVMVNDQLVLVLDGDALGLTVEKRPRRDVPDVTPSTWTSVRQPAATFGTTAASPPQAAAAEQVGAWSEANGDGTPVDWTLGEDPDTAPRAPRVPERPERPTPRHWNEEGATLEGEDVSGPFGGVVRGLRGLFGRRNAQDDARTDSQIHDPYPRSGTPGRDGIETLETTDLGPHAGQVGEAEPSLLEPGEDALVDLDEVAAPVKRPPWVSPYRKAAEVVRVDVSTAPNALANASAPTHAVTQTAVPPREDHDASSTPVMPPASTVRSVSTQGTTPQGTTPQGTTPQGTVPKDGAPARRRADTPASKPIHGSSAHDAKVGPASVAPPSTPLFGRGGEATDAARETSVSDTVGPVRTIRTKRVPARTRDEVVLNEEDLAGAGTELEPPDVVSVDLASVVDDRDGDLRTRLLRFLRHPDMTVMAKADVIAKRFELDLRTAEDLLSDVAEDPPEGLRLIPVRDGTWRIERRIEGS